jgi:aspartyl-tRNA synthetase
VTTEEKTLTARSMEELPRRTHYCADLRESHVGQKVTLYGWVWHWRDHGGVIFIDLRDRTGHVQTVFNPERTPEGHAQADRLRNEYVIAITGEVSRRPEGTENLNLPTGMVEVMVDEVHLLNMAEAVPFEIEDSTEAGENVRLKYRYLDLRRPVMQRIFQTRSRAYQITRDFMHSEGFVEIETPFLAKSTPEGARDYLVPSRVNRGMFYALPQSPQIFKQILMVSGYDKYFQIVKCFRDEDLRADRQPEFTQIDIECSFVLPEDIYDLCDRLTACLFGEILNREIQVPFERMPYREAVDRFGIDRPDVRFGLELVDVSSIAAECEFQVFQRTLDQGGIVRGVNLKGCGSFSRKEIDDLGKEAAIYGAKGLAWMKVTDKGLESSIVKFFPEEVQNRLREMMGAEEGDLLVFVADQLSVVNASLAHLRLLIGRRLKLYDPGELRFLWVTDFPMFEEDEQGSPTPSHHPFTMPVEEDLEFLESDPFRVRAKAYDLVLNGNEIAGGSIRIHRRDIQERVFRAIGIGEEEAQDRFGFLLEAFRYGAPPHGGIAYGFDRVIMLLCGTDNIRDVIAFPKTQRAVSLMDNAPSSVKEEQLRELGIRLR